jgi:hypothetical protein
MEKFSQIIHKNCIPIKIPVFPYLLDHQFMGKAVLPAVESMKILVDSARTHMNNIENAYITNASFDKFLFLREHEDFIEAFNDFEFHENGHIQAKLVTRFQSGKSSITRFIEHVTIHFSFSTKAMEQPPFDPGSLLGKDPFKIAPDVIYRELVPFGPSYRNIREPLLVSPDGAVASVYGGDSIDGDNLLLGSPFTLDAAFHAACAWGQRYHHVVAFPVGFSERHIFRPTCFGNNYTALIKPVHIDKKTLVFDIRIYDRENNIHETISGVRMRDVSGGRLKPPEWLFDKQQVRI